MSPRTPRRTYMLSAALFMLSVIAVTSTVPVAYAQDEAPVYAASSARNAKIEALRQELKGRTVLITDLGRQ